MTGDRDWIAFVEIVTKVAAEAGLSKLEAVDLGMVLHEEFQLHPHFWFVPGNLWKDVDESVDN